MDGTPFGRYRLIELLGRGGMGEVWRAYDTDTDRIVAIKVLPAHLSEDEEFQRRFRREAHTAARLNSPHVIPIHHYGEIDGRLYLDMRLIKGRDLATVLGDGPLDPLRTVNIVGQVAKALHAAHQEGLLHRDIKPSNILLDDDDFAYLIDFGIARTLGETRMTQTGGAVGTYHYIAPERLAIGADEDARADIYSLACVLYECLTGSPPFPGDTMPQLVTAHLHTPPPRPSVSRPQVPAPVDEVVARGMAKDPQQRYVTTVELADAASAAITQPIARPAPAATQLPTAQQTHHVVTAPRMTVMAPSPAPAQLPPPWQPAPPTGGITRRTIALGAGAVVLVAVIASVIGIVALSKHEPSQSSPSSSLPTSGPRSYGAQMMLPFTGLFYPEGVAVDSTGTVYVGDRSNNRVVKLSGGSSTQEVLPFTGLLNPEGVAVDSTGAVYVADVSNNRVLRLAAGSSTQEVLPFTGLLNPDGVAVDSTGSLYVTDYGNNRVLKLSGGSSTQEVLPFTGLHGPHGVAVDSTGTLYVTDTENSRVVKLAAGSSAQEVLPFTGLNGPFGVAVDSARAVYVADLHNSRVVRLAAGSSAQEVPPFAGLNGPWGVAVGNTGTLYVTDQNNNRVLKLPVR